MHQLILLRHGQASPEIAGVSDHERKLTSTGARDAAAIGQAMRQAGLAPDVVLVSTSQRTQETFAALEAQSVWEEWPNIDSLPGLYMATKTQLRDMLRDLPETVRSALVIGHNPGLHELALALAGSDPVKPEQARLARGYPTATLAEFLITTPWRRLGPGSASLQRLLNPADLP
jgi:phosphohistidine phosphatase